MTSYYDDFAILEHLPGISWIDDTEPCTDAARRGQVEYLKRLRAKGCPWDEYTASEAAASGCVETLDWVLKNGCPFDAEYCVVTANKAGHPHIIEWLEENGALDK